MKPILVTELVASINLVNKYHHGGGNAPASECVAEAEQWLEANGHQLPQAEKEALIKAIDDVKTWMVKGAKADEL